MAPLAQRVLKEPPVMMVPLARRVFKVYPVLTVLPDWQGLTVKMVLV
jgi:hypothetical protein